VNYLEATTLFPNLKKNMIVELGKNPSSLISSIQEASKFELKTLPPHLKDAYLGKNSTLAVIISSSLTDKEA